MKKCSNCDHYNPNQAKFCNDCGANLQGICPSCGVNNQSSTKFCMECGTKLTLLKQEKVNKSEPLKIRREAQRRQLTVMFCDLVGSTALSDQLDPEDYRQVILNYQQVAEIVIARNSGHIAQYLGDGLLVYFGYPKGLEDAPKASVQSGLDILEAVAHANKQWKATGKTTIQVRIGIHTGLVVVDDHLALGNTTNIAARLEGLAPINGIVISPQTLKLVKGWFEVKSTGEHLLKGIAQPMEVFQVLHESGVHTQLEIAKGKGLSPLVGRSLEHQLLRERWSMAKTGKGNLVLLRGEAGIGKSRLVDTLKEEIVEESESWLTEIRCSSHHQNSVFYPIIQLLENVVLKFDRNESIESKLNKLESFLLQLGVDLKKSMPLFLEFLSIKSEQYPPPIISPIAKKQQFMEALTHGLLYRAAIHPILLIMEDLHWIDASTLEWLNLFLEQLPSQSVFVLCTTRPDFSAESIRCSEVDQITLQRLTPKKMEKICHHYTNGKILPREISEQIYTKTEGVPLFIEELTKMVLESNLLVENEVHYELMAPLPTLAIPSTLQDSLLARLDRLPTSKEVVQLGAALGREFSFEILNAVLTQTEKELMTILSQLVEAELFYRTGNGKDAGFKFKHALIQDAAYESMLKSQRQLLHQRVAQTLEKQFPHVTQAQPELTADHYTKAQLPLKAIPFWLTAGQMASQKHANQEAISHLEKGLELLHHIEDQEERKNLELDFTLTFGGVAIVYYGYTNPKVGEAFNRAKEIAQSTEISPKLAFILYNLQTYYMLSEQYKVLRELVDYGLRVAEEQKNGYLFKLFGDHIKGVFKILSGEFKEANKILHQNVTYYDPSIPIPLEFTPGGDVKVNAASWLSVSLQISGYMDQAKEISDRHFVVAKDCNESRTLYHIFCWIGWRLTEAKEWQSVEKNLAIYLPTVRGFGDPFFILVTEFFYYLARAHQGDSSAIKKCEERLNIGFSFGTTLFLSTYSPYLFEFFQQQGLFEKTLLLIEKTQTHNKNIGSDIHKAEIYRIKALALQGLGSDIEEVEKHLNLALEIARKQSAKTYELRAAIDLARLWQQQGRAKKGYNLLKDVYDWFTEGFDSVDLKDARVLLTELEPGIF